MEAHAHDLQANTPGTVFYVNQMFYDHYTDVRGNLESYDYEYDFIEKIGMYRIEDAGGKLIFDGEVDDPNVVTVAPNTRSDYTVKLPVTVKQNGVAKVGEPVKHDENGKLSISDVSTIEIPGSRHEQIGKFMATYTKSVDYSEQDNLYTYTLNVKSTTTQEHNITPDTEGVNHVIDFDTNSVVEFEHTIEVTGWYLLQLWGGNGGDGGNSLFGSGSGGTGGTGGYVQGYVHLDKGDVVDIVRGVNGTDNSSKWATAGGGGKHSKAALIKSDGTETVLMIAGGGGGGGHYNFANGYNGSSVTETVTTGTADSANEYSAYDGKSGSGRNGGAAGKNYINTALVKTALNAEDNLDADAVNRFENAATGDYGGAATHGGGTVYVKCLQVTDDGFEEVINTLENALCDFGVKANVSKYFKIESVNVTNTDTEKEAYSASYNYTLGQDTALNIENINPIVETVTSADEKTHSASVDFNIVIRMSASEGFAGGNDIPLFVDKIELNHTQIHRVDGVDQTVEESIELGENDSTDHVNVKLNYQKLTIEGSKLFFSEGDEPIPRDALYTIIAGETPVMPADDDWLYDYVDVVNSITVLGDDEEVADLLAPEITTEYMVRVGVAPKTSSSKARVCDVVEAEVSEDIAIIIVGHEVVFELENLVHDMTALHGKYIAEQDEDLVFSLTPDEDWLYPDDISISIDGKGELTAGVDYTYVKGSGDVTVNASAITGDVTVTASAKAPTYTLTFVYALTPDSSEFERVAQDFAEGADISGAFHSTYAPTAEGYTFHWDWGDGTTEVPDVMPGQDVWIIGRFAPNTYTVTVNFESDDSIELPETIVEEYKYGEQYVITIPY
ncbi:MAG: hypothetical protein IJW79_07840, partial [Clostridia bacterium]|nr:hypothetical protein [Clostridia bacterium]